VKRNSQTILNVAFNGLTVGGDSTPAGAPMFWDLRVRSLEAQALELPYCCASILLDGADGTLFHRSQVTAGSAWTSWQPMEGKLASVALARSYDGKLQLFAADSSRAVYAKAQLTFGGPWSVWERFDGSATSLAAETNADGRSEVFGVTAAGAIFHRRQNLAGETWGAWTRIAGALSNVAVARSFDGRLEVFGSNAAHSVTRGARGGGVRSAS
jgi:hypothetical protein